MRFRRSGAVGGFQQAQEAWHVLFAGAGRWQKLGLHVAKDAYSRAWYLAMRSFYGQRCGIAVDLAGVPGYKHDVCHLEGAYHASSARAGKATIRRLARRGRLWTLRRELRAQHGDLLWTYELFRPQVGKFNLRIPESANGKPDILTRFAGTSTGCLYAGLGRRRVAQTDEREVLRLRHAEKDTMTSYVIARARNLQELCATATSPRSWRLRLVYTRKSTPPTRRNARKPRCSHDVAGQIPERAIPQSAGVATGEYGDATVPMSVCGPPRNSRARRTTTSTISTSSRTMRTS